MKLKQLAGDFKVVEINNFKISKEKGGYKLFLLEKKNLETFSLLNYLSRKNNIPVEEFGIAGLKDRYAITCQYLTIPSKFNLNAFKEEKLRITFLGYVDKKLELGDLTGNKFDITARDINKEELRNIIKRAETMPLTGVPNYFDSQRFGSVIKGKFIAKLLLKKQYEQAAKIYLTQSTKYEPGIIKAEKRSILQNWGCLSKLRIKTFSLKMIVEEYKKGNDWLCAYKKIPSRLRQIYISAYQSYLWNECIKLLLGKKINNKYLYSVPYSLGTLLYYRNLTPEKMNSMPKTFKTISENIKPSKIEKEIIYNVLEKEGVCLEDFNIKKQTGNFFKVHERDILLRPSEFKMSDPLKDELNKNSFKITFSFALPKGSYATVVTKRLFNK